MTTDPYEYDAPAPIVHPPGDPRAAGLRALYDVPPGGRRRSAPAPRSGGTPGDLWGNLQKSVVTRNRGINAEYDARARMAWDLIQSGMESDAALKAAKISATAARPRWARMGLGQ